MITAAGRRAGLTPAVARGAYGIPQNLGILGGRTGAAAGVGTTLGGKAMNGLRAAGRFAAPVAGFMAALDFASFPGSLDQRANAAISGATLGLIPGPRRPGETIAAASGQIGEWGHMTPSQLKAEIARQRGIAGSGTPIIDDDTVLAGLIGTSSEEAKLAGVTANQLERILKVTQEQNEALRRQKRIAEANDFLTNLDRAFAVGSRHQKAGKAMDQLTDMAMNKLKGLGRDGQVQTAQNTLDWAREQARQNPKLEDEFRELRQKVLRQFDETGRRVEIINGKIYTGTKREWDGIQKAISGNAIEAQRQAKTAFTRLQQDAVGSLRAMGYSPTEASSIVETQETYKTSNTAFTDDNTRRGSGLGRGAKGMRIGGVGLGDTIPLTLGMAAPGELIVNRHTEQRINRMLGGKTTLGAEVAGERRPHSEPVPEKFARGGRVPHGGIVGLGEALRRQGFVVTGNAALGSPPSPGAHAANSYHYRGMAIDVNADAMPGGEARHLNALYNRLARMPGILELFYQNRGIPSAIPDHYDHLHVAMGGAGAAAAAVGALTNGTGALSPARLKRLITNLGGAPGALAQRSMDVQRKGLEDRINERLGAGVGGVANNVVGGGLRAWLTQALRLTGHFTPGNLQALIGRAMQESGGDPRAINNWDSNAAAGTPSKGLLQTIDPTFNAYKMPGMNNIWNPVHNAVAAIRYMMARYGHIVGPSSTGYAMGGRIPWFGDGGSFIAANPMTIGVGERGPERVDVRPIGSRGGGGGTVVIENMRIENHRRGDIKAQIEAELKAVVRGLENNRWIDDDGVMD